MNDEFLHHLRKEPRPEFAARLQSRLRRQPTRPLPPGAPARARTLLTLLLLGGTAFAVTALLTKGLPTSVLVLYQHTVTWIRAAHSNTATGQAAGHGMREGLAWGGSASSAPQGAALHAGPAHSAAPPTGAQGATTSSAGSAGGSASVGVAGGQLAQIRAVSSWAAYPYSAVIADNFNRSIRGRMGEALPPQIDMSVRDSDLWPGPMCGGGASAPDIAYAFERAGTVSEHPCPGAPGKPSYVMALPVGYEAVILERSPLYGELDFTSRQLFLALAKWVPDPARAGTVHENTSTNWRQIDAAMAPEPIELMGPPLSSPAARSMIELLLEHGCRTYPWIAALASTDPAKYDRICRTVRTDAVYVEVPGLAAPTLLAEPNAVGIAYVHWSFGFPSLAQVQPDGLAVSRLDGVAPTPEDIQSGAYPGSRAFYFYVNRGRVPRNMVLWLMGRSVLPFADWAVFPPPEEQFRANYAEALGP